VRHEKRLPSEELPKAEKAERSEQHRKGGEGRLIKFLRAKMECRGCGCGCGCDTAPENIEQRLSALLRRSTARVDSERSAAFGAIFGGSSSTKRARL
jgi:hypothetical protein